MVDYARPTFSPCAQKPARGSLLLEREKDAADAVAVERREKAAAKKRDGRCRWPEPHTCRGELEAAHIVDASLGGAMCRKNLVSLCGWIHRRGPESIHGKQLRIEIEDDERGADGGLSFWRKGEDGEFFLIARETAPGQVERD